MKTKYNIEVSENANIGEIAAKIVKGLQKQKAIEFKQQQKYIGNVVDIIPPEINITVTRKIPKHADLCKCIICGTEYLPEAAFYYYSNYGGGKIKKHVCSKECFAPIKEFAGDRVNTSKAKLKPAIQYRFDGKLHKEEYKPLQPTPNTICLRKSGNEWIWTKDNMGYTPTLKDIKAVELILKLTK